MKFEVKIVSIELQILLFFDVLDHTREKKVCEKKTKERWFCSEQQLHPVLSL